MNGGYNSSQIFTILRTKMNGICTVGRYVEPKVTNLPYIDFLVKEVTGNSYDIVGEEGGQTVMFDLNSYATGNGADSTCEKNLLKAHDILVKYGFQRKSGPIKVTTEKTIPRWVSRYQRIICNGDEIKEMY